MSLEPSLLSPSEKDSFVKRKRNIMKVSLHITCFAFFAKHVLHFKLIKKSETTSVIFFTSFNISLQHFSMLSLNVLAAFDISCDALHCFGSCSEKVLLSSSPDHQTLLPTSGQIHNLNYNPLPSPQRRYFTTCLKRAETFIVNVYLKHGITHLVLNIFLVCPIWLPLFQFFCNS